MLSNLKSILIKTVKISFRGICKLHKTTREGGWTDLLWKMFAVQPRAPIFGFLASTQKKDILVHIYNLSTGEWRQKNHGGFLGIQFIKINELQG